MGLVSEILQKVDSVTLSYTAQAYQAIVSQHSTELRLMLVLYIAFYGLAVLQGIIPGTTREMAKHILKAFIVFALATNWGMFTTFFYDVFSSGPDKIIAALTGEAKPSEQLSSIYDSGILSAARIFIKAGTLDFGIMLMAFLVAIATMCMTGFALFLIILAKLGIAILLSLAPLFIALALWRGTQGIFQSWVNYLINFALIPVITYALLSLILVIMEEAAKKIEVAGEAVTLNDVMPFLLVGGITGLLFAQVSGIASSLGSGMALSTMGAINRYISSPTKQIAAKTGAKLSKARSKLAYSKQSASLQKQGNSYQQNPRTRFTQPVERKNSSSSHLESFINTSKNNSTQHHSSNSESSKSSVSSHKHQLRFSEKQNLRTRFKRKPNQGPVFTTQKSPGDKKDES